MALSPQLQMYTPIWQLFDNNGKPLTNGAIFFFDNDSQNTPKNVYIDETGATAWPNPIILNAGGFQPQNYGIFGTGSYHIEVHKTADRSSQLIFAQDNYIPPATSGNTPINESTDIQNFIQNGQFTIHGQEYAATSISVPASILNLAPGGWVFIKNDTSSNDEITFPAVSPGQTDIPANPNNIFQYQCNSLSITESLKYLGYRFYNYSNDGLNAGSGVNTLAGQQVTMQFEATSVTNSIISFSVYQYFGANGSAPVLTPFTEFQLDTQWPSAENGSPFNFTFTVPSIEGKTIDPNGGDYLELRWNFPLNTVSQVQMVNFGIQQLGAFVPYSAIPIYQLESQLMASQFPIVSTQNQKYLDGNYEYALLKGSTAATLLPMAGRIIYWPVQNSPLYGLECNGYPVYSKDYYNLAQVLNYETAPGQNFIPWGIGPSSFFCAAVSTPVISTTNLSNGAVSAGSAGSTPFTFNQTSLGSVSTQATATITVTAANTVTQGQYFLINSAYDEYYVWLSLNNFTIDPGTYLPILAGKKGVKVIYTGSETDVQLAQLIYAQLLVAQFRVPDFRGLFIRMWADGVAAVLSEYASVTFQSTFNYSTVNFTIVGFDDVGNPVTEVLAGPNNNTVNSVNKYQGIASITPSATLNIGVINCGDANSSTGLFQLLGVTASVAPVLNGPYQRDPDYLSRTYLYANASPNGDVVGSKQLNQNQNHFHVVNYLPENGTAVGSGAFAIGTGGSLTTEDSGGNQSNPNNVYANTIILF